MNLAALKAQIQNIADEAGVSAEKVEDFLRIMQGVEEDRLDRSGPIAHMNRAARRARARAERKGR